MGAAIRGQGKESVSPGIVIFYFFEKPTDIRSPNKSIKKLAGMSSVLKFLIIYT